MEAKEKAIELVEKFTPLVEYWDFCNCELRINEDIIADSKQCALIAVNEIIDSHYISLVGVKQKIIDYWQEVKIEIEKL